jgi:hypothetical protein
VNLPLEGDALRGAGPTMRRNLLTRLLATLGSAAFCFFGAFAPSAAFADVVVTTAVLDASVNSGSHASDPSSVTIPAFDASLGTLTGVEIDYNVVLHPHSILGQAAPPVPDPLLFYNDLFLIFQPAGYDFRYYNVFSGYQDAILAPLADGAFDATAEPMDILKILTSPFPNDDLFGTPFNFTLFEIPVTVSTETQGDVPGFYQTFDSYAIGSLVVTETYTPFESVPEPSSLLILLGGLVCLDRVRRPRTTSTPSRS